MKKVKKKKMMMMMMRMMMMMMRMMMMMMMLMPWHVARGTWHVARGTWHVASGAKPFLALRASQNSASGARCRPRRLTVQCLRFLVTRIVYHHPIPSFSTPSQG